jgi:hypothetical protein
LITSWMSMIGILMKNPVIRIFNGAIDLHLGSIKPQHTSQGNPTWTRGGRSTQ